MMTPDEAAGELQLELRHRIIPFQVYIVGDYKFYSMCLGKVNMEGHCGVHGAMQTKMDRIGCFGQGSAGSVLRWIIIEHRTSQSLHK